MASAPPALHIYNRDIQAHERTSLSVLAAHIPAGARVLDLGCGSGAIGRHLAERDGAVAGPIDGLTISTDEAALAAPHYRRVEVADLDAADLGALYPAASYDIIVCADVLEHIRGSDRVLAHCRKLLAPGGRALLSIPNAGYSGLVAELMAGEFRYRPEGLLDETHVRFFTRRTLMRFLADNGWVVDQVETVERDMAASEFRVAFDALPPAVARHLLTRPDALTYQFVVVTHPLAAGERAPAPAVPHSDAPGLLPAHASFTAQLFFGQGGTYVESAKALAAGVIGKLRQTLRFSLPRASQPLTGLRFDPADRPGFMHLHALRLNTSEGRSLWTWESTDFAVMDHTPSGGIVIQPPWPGADALVLLLHGDDPWIELPIPHAVLAQAAGGTLEVDMGWPMSADYLAIAGVVERLQDALDRSDEALRGKREAFDDLNARHRLLEQVHSQLREQHRVTLERSSALNTERDEAMALVKSIQNSTVFRASRPIVHAKMRIDRLLGVGSARPQPTRAEAVPLTPPEHPVDIIVPVYRSLQDTQRCVESVLASRCRTPWRLLIINDASPEPEVTEWLRRIAPTDPRIELLENEQNQGFVGTVNRGMAATQTHDVLLLNSDTEVAGDWLDRIRAAAYGDQRIASVTPFSNNATICSYPRFCQDNPLPEAWSTAELDTLAASVNAGQVVDVPTGVGFCMYIRRAALEQVGLFDVENFGKGYGEENDFCVRAAKAGWRNLHALDTFVRHFGGVSFGASKSPRERAAMETMRRLHPRYERDVIAFVQADPAAAARAALDLARATARRLPVVLAIMHNREGGTMQHVRDLARTLAGQASFLMLQPERGGEVALRLAEPDSQLDLRFTLPEKFDDLIDVLRVIGVRHIHYHHLLGHSSLLREQLPQRLGVSHDFTVHDFYSVCPQISMVGPNGVYCGEEGPEQCRACLQRHPAPGGATIAAWRNDHTRLLRDARHVITPSRDVLQRMGHYVPAANYQLVPHLEPDAAIPPPRPAARADGAPLKIAIIGALSAIKGADLLEDVATAARSAGAPLDFHLLGFAYRNLRTQPKASLTVHGPYEDADLPALLQWLQPDLVWFPAQIPESYSYTLSAALRAGLPVVATNLGAFAERLQGRAWSWVEPWDQGADAWLAFFQRLLAEHFATGMPPATAAATHAVNPGPVMPITPAVSAQWYHQTYLAHLPAPGEAPTSIAAIVARHQAPPETVAGAKGSALQVLARLRAMPMLSPVARAIPPRWQARVKNWLQR